MRYLFDTHTFLWMAAVPAKLSEKITGIVQASDNRLLLSAASGWEIALLWHLKRLELPDQPQLIGALGAALIARERWQASPAP